MPLTRSLALLVALALMAGLATAAPVAIERQYTTARGMLPVRYDVTPRQAKNVKSGTVVEWRGMVDYVSFDGKSLYFVLKVGTDKMRVRVKQGSFRMHEGEPVGVLGRVKKSGRTTELDLVAAAPAARVGLSGDVPWTPLPAYAGADLPSLLPGLKRWVLSFNRSLSNSGAERLIQLIWRYSKHERIDPRLMMCLVAAESAFRSDATSPVGAQGLGQLMPGTAAMLGVSNAYDPEQNLSGATRYLGSMLRRWNGSTRLALASYNAGPGAVEQYGGVPPYAETQNYVRYILALYRELGGK